MIAAAVTTRAAVPEAGDDRLLRLGAVDVLLPHPGDEEDLVVHGEAEHDADQEDRQQADDRAGLVDAEDVREPAPLEDRDHDAERGDDAEQEAQRRP